MIHAWQLQVFQHSRSSECKGGIDERWWVYQRKQRQVGHTKESLSFILKVPRTLSTADLHCRNRTLTSVMEISGEQVWKQENHLGGCWNHPGTKDNQLLNLERGPFLTSACIHITWGLVKTLRSLRWDPGICTSCKFPGYASAAGPGTTLWEPLACRNRKGIWG